MIVYTARWLLPVSSPPVADGAVGVGPDGRIAYVGPAAAAPPGTRHPLGDAVLLPGLVAVAAGSAPAPAIATLPAAGVTTLAVTIARDPDLDALLASGLRAVAYHSVAGPAPAEREPAFATLRTAVARTRAAITAAGAVGRVRAGVAPGPINAIDEDLLLDICAWAVAEDLPLAISSGATAAEVAYVRDAAGPHADAGRAAGRDVVRRAHSTVHLLAELGVAAVARPLLTGAAYFDESDIALAAYYDCPVAYTPSATPPTAGPLPALLDAGVRACLGAVTGLLAAARQLARPPAEALHLVTLGAARALGLDGDVGSLDVGKFADLCAFALTPPALAAAASFGPTHALGTGPARSTILTTVRGTPLPPPARTPLSA